MKILSSIHYVYTVSTKYGLYVAIMILNQIDFRCEQKTILFFRRGLKKKQIDLFQQQIKMKF